MTPLTQRYASQIAGVLSCYDRIVISGTLPGVCFAEGMSTYLRVHGIRIFDYPRFAEPLREEIRQNAERIARDNGLEIEFIRSVRAFRKEDRIRAILQQRGDQPGLVHIFSAMEPCPAFTPWHDKATGKTSLRYKDGKCLHYYFYFLDPQFGLCYLRVPTWAPFRLQFYCNGHNWLAGQLQRASIAFQQLDNTFSSIVDWSRAQTLSDAFPIEQLHRALDGFATQYCPVARQFGTTYHWSLMQVEYATDIVFHRQADLRPLYETLVRTAIHAVKADNVATFLGRKLHANYRDELGNDFHTRIEGARLKHHMGPVSIKLYDKQGLVMRIETTVNDVSFFRHHRTVEHRDHSSEAKLAPMKKTIYSLAPLRELLLAANRRYLAFLSDLVDPSPGIEQVEHLAEPVRQEDRTYRGFNLFDSHDLALFLVMARGEWHISGFRNATLRRILIDRSGPQVSRLLKRLHLHGLIKKIGHTYKYYLSETGRRVILT
ncbi:MAG: MarR family transcriptional regulator, partial [bacterium]|nr:MarR family transcriptional regulator [bacterium]